MTKTTVVNLKFAEYDVYIGRAGQGFDGYFGNPFKLTHEMHRAAILAQFKVYFLRRLAFDPTFRDRVLELRGKRLGCFCAPLPCHGDVIAEYLNGLP